VDAQSEDSEDTPRTTENPAKSGLSNPTTLHGGQQQQVKKKEGNPFRDYEDSGQRQMWERKWLLDIPEHLDMRAREFARNGVMVKLMQRHKDPEEAYEDAVYHGAYSIQVRENVALQRMKAEMRRLRCESEAGSSPACSIADAKKMLSTSLPQLRSKLGKQEQQQSPDNPQTRRADRNATTAAVKLLKVMQKELIDSNWTEKKAKEAAIAQARQEASLQNKLKGLNFGFENKLEGLSLKVT
jgi:hypothetical protein